jgi:hypothetical protein
MLVQSARYSLGVLSTPGATCDSLIIFPGNLAAIDPAADTAF